MVAECVNGMENFSLQYFLSLTKARMWEKMLTQPRLAAGIFCDTFLALLERIGCDDDRLFVHLGTTIPLIK